MGRHRAVRCVHGHRYDARNRYIAPDGKQRCRTCARIAEAKRTRDYSYRKTARCSQCGKPCWPSWTIGPDGRRAQRPSQTCHDCRRAARAAA